MAASYDGGSCARLWKEWEKEGWLLLCLMLPPMMLLPPTPGPLVLPDIRPGPEESCGVLFIRGPRSGNEETSWLEIGKHRKCLSAPWRPSKNTDLCCSCEAYKFISHIQKQINTVTASGLSSNRHLYKAHWSIHIKKWCCPYVSRKQRGGGDGVRRNMYTHISYIIQSYPETANIQHVTTQHV